MIDHSSVRVLIADDDDISCKVLSAMLNCHGYKSQCVSNGQDCINAMKSSQFDLILLDWIMPIMNGRETVSLIRNGAAGDHYKEIPIIAVTADLIISPRDKCIQAGADECLYKPLDFKKLSNVLEEKLAAIPANTAHTLIESEVNSAINFHKQFVRDVSLSVNSNSRVQQNLPTKYTSCKFGRWLSTESSTNYISADNHERISATHQRIHRLADEVFLLLNRNERHQANKVAHEIEELSREIVVILESC